MFSRPLSVMNYLQPRWTAPVSFTSLPTFRLFSLSHPLVYGLVALLLLTLLPPASSAAQSTTLAACPVQPCVASYSPQQDYFPIKVPSTPDWTVYYFPSYRFVVNRLSPTPETYLLYKCGTPIPSTNSSAGLTLDPSILPLFSNRTKLFSTPITSIGVDSSVGSVVVTFIELLGIRSLVTHLDTTYVTSPCIDLLAQQGAITKLTFNATTAASVQLLLEGNSATAYPNSVSIAASADADVLRRAGWVKLLALFVDKEEAALGLYNDMQFNYEELQYPAVTRSPVIAWVSAYSGSYTLYRTNYRDNLTLAASGLPLTSVAVTTTYPSSALSAFKAALRGVDILIDDSYFSPLTTNYTAVYTNLGFNSSDLRSPLYPFLLNGAVWRDDGRDSYNSAGDDWSPQ